jgi:hypothetical protein
MGMKRNGYRILDGKHEGRLLLEGSGSVWELINI